MKKMKRIYSIILSFVLSLFIFSGCAYLENIPFFSLDFLNGLSSSCSSEKNLESSNNSDDSSKQEEVEDVLESVFEGRQSILLLGQSNMAGRGNVADVEPISDDRIFMINQSNEWVKMQEPIHFDKSAAGVGLAASFAKGFVETFDCEVGLIPGAYGGTSISDWKVGGTYYTRALDMAKEAQKDSNICAILWHQGESNVSNTSNYAAKLQVILDSFIEELSLNSKEIIVVAGELREKSIDLMGREKLHTELAKLSEVYKNYGIASSAGLTLKSDNIHFDSASLRVFGYRYFDIFKQLVTGESYEFVNEPDHYFIGEKVEPNEGENNDSSSDTIEPEEPIDPSLVRTEIEGTIVADTYISSSNKDGNNVSKDTIGAKNDSSRPLYKFSFSNIMTAGEFNEYKATAKVEFTFAIVANATSIVSDTKCSAYGFKPGAGVSDIDFSTLTWNTCSKTGVNNALYRGTATYLFKDALLGSCSNIKKTDTHITYTFTYSEIEQFICMDEGDTYGYVVMGFDFSNSSGVKYASMENTSYDIPRVDFVYYK